MPRYRLERCALCGAHAEMYYRKRQNELRYFAMCCGIVRHRTEEHTSARAAAREWRQKMTAAKGSPDRGD